jgi:hypothetical protein
VDEAVDDLPGTLEVTQRSQHLPRQPGRPLSPQVGPRRWDQRTRTVRQHQYQLQAALPAHPAEDLEGPTEEWVTLTDHRHLPREVFEVGSVSPTCLAGNRPKRSASLSRNITSPTRSAPEIRRTPDGELTVVIVEDFYSFFVWMVLAPEQDAALETQAKGPRGQ